MHQFTVICNISWLSSQTGTLCLHKCFVIEHSLTNCQPSKYEHSPKVGMSGTRYVPFSPLGGIPPGSSGQMKRQHSPSISSNLAQSGGEHITDLKICNHFLTKASKFWNLGSQTLLPNFQDLLWEKKITFPNFFSWDATFFFTIFSLRWDRKVKLGFSFFSPLPLPYLLQSNRVFQHSWHKRPYIQHFIKLILFSNLYMYFSR